jgi:RNA polymerase sigma factor (sigma-70 family)
MHRLQTYLRVKGADGFTSSPSCGPIDADPDQGFGQTPAEAEEPSVGYWTDFEEFYRQHYRPLIKIVLLAHGSIEEAEDAVNDTMVEMLRNWAKISYPKTYACRAVASNFIKRRMRDRQQVPRMIEGGHVTRDADDGIESCVWEEQEWVVQLLNSLPAAQREVLALIYDQLSIQEVAELLGKTPEAIRKNLQLARQRLMSDLQKRRQRARQLQADDRAARDRTGRRRNELQ